jgi:glycosyltransferase involved in cell wall biosynthesis
MNVAIVMDNNVAKRQVTPFEIITQTEKNINFVALIGEKNRHDTASIRLHKIFLNHRSEILLALSTPSAALNRLKENRFPRMDFYYFSLRNYLKDFDVVFTQEVTRSLYTLASLKERFKYKIVLRWWENLPYKRLFNEKDLCIAKRSLDKVDLFLPATDMARDSLLLEGTPEEKIVHLSPGIDTDRFVPAERSSEMRTKLSIPPESIVVLFVGRLVSHKGVHVLLWTAKRLEKTAPMRKFVFVIVGSGGLKAQLESMACEMGLKDKFIVYGEVPYDNIPEIYQMSDVFVLPSLMKENIQEQFGLVLAEAMACGKPVIGSAVGGIPEVIGDSGILVPPGDFRALADKLITLASDDHLRQTMGEKARRRAVQLFSDKKMAEELLLILRRF